MLLEVKDLCLTFDKKTIFNHSSFRVLEGDRIGLVGDNGVGKTTLIQVLCSKIIPDKGSIEFNKSIKVGYLDQFMMINQTLSIEDYLKEAFKDLFDRNQEMNCLLDEMTSSKDNNLINRNLNKTTIIREYLENHDFYQINSTIAKVTSGLGINNYGLDTLLKKLSGGQKMKVILAKLLLEQPDLLILDEPTNFLDSIHVDWLVKYLKEYKGNFLIVSHSPDFLNDVVNTIFELEQGLITRYKGNYATYLEKKALMMENYSTKVEKQQKEIKKLETYIQKNKVKTSTAKQAKSREKKLDSITRLQPLSTMHVEVNLHFNYSPIASHKILEVKDLEIGYTSSLLPPISFQISSGTRLAITGFNGIGKTTLLKTLLGILSPIKGTYRFVENAKIAYFEQEHHFDDLERTPLEEIHEIYPLMESKEIRSNLARCGLRSELALQPIKTLSGGEQSKLKLCKIMMTKANILILDEPTNHLDSLAVAGLLSALMKYQGTILFVSHERSFIDELKTREYSIEDLLLS